MADRFFSSESLAPGELTFTGAEANHIANVRRFSVGDLVTFFNGDGNEYPAEILAASKRNVTVRIVSVQHIDRELPFSLTIAAAIPKGDRADFLIEKLTELGVSRFVPLVTERSIVQPKETTVEKFSRAVIEASKQCGRNRLMAIDTPRKWELFVGGADLPMSRFLLHTDMSIPMLTRISDSVVISVGPEGGFTPDEVAAAVASGWRSASLGPRVLRMETAAIAAAVICGTSIG